MLPHQPLRFLLADDPGATKMIMAGLLMKELNARGISTDAWSSCRPAAITGICSEHFSVGRGLHVDSAFRLNYTK
jgi:hypothetical protein